MDKNLEAVRRAQVERTIKALAQNRIPAVYALTREEGRGGCAGDAFPRPGGHLRRLYNAGGVRHSGFAEKRRL